ncbi:hypothetical protein [Flavobacterium sp.]|uniref:hypothetical protein n=1 Tax=Flavobacterium sp. TaxID=239 RepID=UPI003751A837
MIVSVTKIELNSYSKLFAFFKFNGQIISELKQSPCKKFELTGNWNLKIWYTMTLWDNEIDISNFYKNGVHLEAMKKANVFSSKIQSKRVQNGSMMSWKEAKKLFI